MAPSVRLAGLVACLLLSASPLVSAAPEDLNAHALNVLVYHPLPDEQGDDWGVPALTVNGTNVDWMAGYYGAYFFPTAVFDGVELLESTPTGEGAGAFQETLNGYEAALERRLLESAPVSLSIDASIEERVLTAQVTVEADGLVDEDGLQLRIVAFEDDVAFSGGNGVVNHRFVVRSLGPTFALDLSSGSQTQAVRLQLANIGDTGRAGLVAIVQNSNETSSLFDPKEVVQSASWRADQVGATSQASKGVLLELYSATWCAACIYGDTAADTLADEFGIQSSKATSGGFEYLRPADALRVGAAALLGLGVAAWILRPRERKEAGP